MTKTLRVGMTFLVAVFGWVNATGAVEIAGIVVDEAGNPLNNASVVIQEQDPRFIVDYWGKVVTKGVVRSGADGKFSFPMPDVGFEALAIQITTQHPDYGISVLYPNELSEQGKSISECRIVLSKRGSIQGKVVNRLKKPVKDATVSVAVTQTGGRWFSSFMVPDSSLLSTRTDAKGRYKLDGLPQDAKVAVRVSHPAYAIALVGLSGGEQNFDAEGTIPVGSIDTIVTLQPGATIRGKITWKGNNARIEQVPVIAAPKRTYQLALLMMPDLVETDKKGSFKITGVAPGSYKLQTGPFDRGVIAPQTIEITASNKIVKQDLTAVEGVEVTGKFVKADTKEAVGGGSIYLRSTKDPNAFTFVKVNPDGTFKGRIAAEEVIVSRMAQNGSLDKKDETFPIRDGQHIVELVIEVKPPLTFKGRVLDTEGKPIAGARVFSGGWGSGGVFVLSDQEGFFRDNIPSNMTFQDFPSFRCVYESFHPDKPGLRGIIIKEARSKDDLCGDIVLTPVCILRGKVLDTEGNPVSSARIETLIHTGRFETFDRRGRCDGSGAFEINDAIGGFDHSVRVTASNRYGQARVDQAPVKSGATWDVGTLVLVVTNKVVEGTVTDEKGFPAPGVRLTAYGKKTGTRSARTDDKGHFSIENLADESLRIDARKGPRGQLGADTIANAGQMDVELRLREVTKP